MEGNHSSYYIMRFIEKVLEAYGEDKSEFYISVVADEKNDEDASDDSEETI